ncbi:MAG: hypothetical protein ACI8UD_003048 [Planctomycetota bacterium]|jgi:hypothetical protein
MLVLIITGTCALLGWMLAGSWGLGIAALLGLRFFAGALGQEA